MPSQPFVIACIGAPVLVALLDLRPLPWQGESRPIPVRHVTELSADIEQRLRSMGASVTSWANSPGDRYAAHQHGYDKIVVIVEGSISFLLPTPGTDIKLHVGDRLDLPAGTSHAATVGDAGVRCLEAHLPSGGLGMHPRRVAGWGLGAPASIHGGTRKPPMAPERRHR